jgi:diadenosine tetraphosphate (Ap4A) HIT family hydrolase
VNVPTDCIVCRFNDRIGHLPPREEIEVSGRWRVAHAFGTSLPGWLVVAPTCHVTALQELAEEDASQLGRVLHRASRALCEVFGCDKTYVVFFAEAEGFAHLHIHVIPRMAWFAPEQRGPGVFSLLGVASSEEVPEHERDRLALIIRNAMRAT